MQIGCHRGHCRCVTTWSRYLHLYYDVDSTAAVPLLRFDGDSVATGAAPSLVQSDHFPFAVHLMRRSAGNEYEALSIPPGHVMVFAGKVGETLLFSATGFVEATDDRGSYYEAELDLHTDALATAIGTKAEITVRCDLEIQNADNTRRYTIQADFVVRRQSYAGEGSPTPSAPLYPSPDQVALRDPGGDANYRITADGEVEFLNMASEAFEPLDARHQSGIVLLIEDGAMAVYVNGIRRGAI